ncbi:WYL domain-containing protein [Chryseobacterium formosus]|uniref:WYL domain-containing protein n=1 Tax=Chryseobacterium formosus TaxID=1537363 RepID=A0ABT3XRC0_9FLAO|nr:WYL domain-containing protein [Chryseobacterium formosus]MCX8524674.1 WYL domain-containing protein [Chryseobacterium formosus]
MDVLATDDSEIPFKSYALERIKKIEILGNFKPKQIDFKIPYKHAVGMFTNCDPEEIILEFDHRDGHYLKANPIHSSQQILAETPDRIQFRFFVKPNEDFLMEVLKRSWSVKVLEPETLKKKMKKFWTEALDRNN